MVDTTHTPSVGRDDNIGQMAQNAHDLATHWRQGVDGPISEGAAQAVTQVQHQVSAAVQAVGTGMAKAHQARNNLDIHPDGRMMRAQEATAEAQATSGENLANAEAALQVAQALLTADALPKMPRGEDANARADVQMALRGSTKDFRQKMAQLAQGDDGVAALVCDPVFMGRYLMGRGVDASEVGSLVNFAQQHAILAAGSGDNEGRKAAAQLLARARRNLQGAITSAHQVRRTSVQRSSR